VHAAKLSVVVVAYDMPHQIVRTVRSLSPAMQRGVAAEDYELLVVDNGSPQPIDREACEAYGATIRSGAVDHDADHRRIRKGHASIDRRPRRRCGFVDPDVASRSLRR